MTFSDELMPNEVWLEGDEVSKVTYEKLYLIYGDAFGTPQDPRNNFVLPDCRNRTVWGISHTATLQYKSAGLPNITGQFQGFLGSASGAFKNLSGGWWLGNRNPIDERTIVSFKASWSNPIYGNSDTVQPPAFSARFKTRYK